MLIAAVLAVAPRPVRTPWPQPEQRAALPCPDRGRDWIEVYIIQQMQDLHIAGLTACIVVGDEVVWTFAHGYQQLFPERLATDSTLFMMASISKTFTGTAVLQLWEDGLIDLYARVNDYLTTLQVENPVHPSPDISIWNLVTHTSSLRDNWTVMMELYTWGADSPIPLGEYLFDYFDPSGEYYDRKQNFYDYPPGAYWNYCNEAYALMGYLVEEVTGSPFDEYCNQNLFEPMGMYETSWFLADLDTTRIAMPYQWTGSRWQPYGHYGYPDYPAGQLRTSSGQLAQLLIAFLNDGWVNGYQLLDSATVAEATTLQCPGLNSSMGLTWFKSQAGSHTVWGHGGGDLGVSTQFGFCPSEGTGVVVLTNSDAGLWSIFVQLFDYAAELTGCPEQGPQPGDCCSIAVTPNPMAHMGWILVGMPEAGSASVAVYDLAGRVVMQVLEETPLPIGASSLALDSGDLPPGVYVVVLRTAYGSKASRFIRTADTR
ncbi:serine hydrolase [Candidatus Fermentibacterales bacterium]|nr:serine hydrolase [Candidatus Fermentibacterales bacterium]